MTEGEKRIIPRIYTPDGTPLQYPLRSRAVANAFAQDQTSNFHRLERGTGVIPSRDFYRSKESRWYQSNDVMQVLQSLQSLPPRVQRRGQERFLEPAYPQLAGKDLARPGTEIVMGVGRRDNGWKIVIEEESRS